MGCGKKCVCSLRLAPLSTLLAMTLVVIQLVLLEMLKLLNVLRWSLRTR